MEPAPPNGPYPHAVGAGATVGRFVAESEVHSGKATDHAVGAGHSARTSLPKRADEQLATPSASASACDAALLQRVL